MKRTPYKWVLFHIDSKYHTHISKELDYKGYDDIKVCIPTLHILRKRSKGKDIYEDVPLLFNYGFLRMPTEKAYSRPFLNKLKKDIAGIHSFVKSLESIHPKKKRKRIDNAEDFDDFSIVATVPRKEVHRFKRLSKENQIYTKDEIVNLPIGSYVVLRGYPFEGVPATVEDINLTTKMVTLLLYPEDGKMIRKLPFENVVYSIYHNYDEDKLYANNLSDISDNLTQISIDDFIENKTV